MSRELLGFALLAVACIILTPFYNVGELAQKRILEVEKEKSKIPESKMAQADSSKSIILLSDSFLPTTFAGSEISAFETIKYLRSRGHKISIFVNTWEVKQYDGFQIYKYNVSDPFCKSQIQNADFVFFQMGYDPKNMELLKGRANDVFVFTHLIEMHPWLLQQKMSFPVTVIYNSHMTQDYMPTLHPNMRMIPYVETNKFKNLRQNTINNDVVCLINCNKNKGGDMLKVLAEKMPDVQFMGVKGGYSSQVTVSNTGNLIYIENQKDITVVFKQIGILIMPSKNETWGRTAVEAMASGVPVIHSESPGLVECVGGAGIMCMHDDEDAWVDAIRRIVGDRAYRERMRQYGFKRTEEIEKEQIRGRQELAMKIEG
uniref:Glycosyl transferase family 1 domain-containing protein n=1 Tax=viral metagenome TaxID=1070528 RepID=A0A6C0AMT9_9ZZZZ